VKSVTDVIKEGEKLTVKVIDISRDGKIRLSHKATLAAPEGTDTPDSGGGENRGGGRPGGGRPGGGGGQSRNRDRDNRGRSPRDSRTQRSD
jgi:hypothetical protein